MITRRSINKTKAVSAIKTLDDYLDEQDAILDAVMKILSREYQAIKERRLEELETIAEDKSSFMLKLQANDQRLKLHPDAAMLKTVHIDRVNQLKEKLGRCKMMNETNGKLISLSIAANRRLTSVLMSARDRMSRNMTYNDKGNTTATGPLRVNINA
ncbi:MULTISPECIES: flagellar protein FlgN [unclassified Anaerobiospirillum]|uniref:flagella synthesis protein FlgN n=1 Tax=unclassified Anaerobiospirillum TaxID=2647410 RepID=UPI001FF16CD9|nr:MULTISPECIES: flagellar protein FlgN [unclassified Anaerobiospirillum]MCK0526674.1 flagellar protein FlgN [Anaerobiospirillum sp. NML120449]MCK0534325.1 flagellar protein FlgN [Anaerobiospirillum sp. NML120511]MCK0539594.1 flagellar protein FlgN [Anaerobiospirillum sp. NML02-A-032]